MSEYRTALVRIAELGQRVQASLPELEAMGMSEVGQEFDIESLYRLVSEAGREWNRAEAQASSMEETRRPLLAALTLKELEQVEGKRKSKAEAELIAMASPAYLNHISEMVRARKISNSFRIRYDTGNKLIDMLRTKEANHRAAR